MSDAFRARVGAICGALPGAEVSDPWGGVHDAWKVGNRMFACIGAMQQGVAVKCRDVETATMLKEAGVAAHARYFHKSWVLMPEETDEEELRHRLQSSYDIIRGKLPAALRRQFSGGGEPA